MGAQERNCSENRGKCPADGKYCAQQRRGKGHGTYFSHQRWKQRTQLFACYFPNIRVLRIVIPKIIPQQRSSRRERAAQLGGRLGGHIVQGHVDAVGKVAAISKKGAAIEIGINYPNEISKYIVDKGSITVDGVSLTVNRVEKGRFTVMVIPHTKLRTTFSNLFIGQEVNLEVDILGKYVEKLAFLDSEDVRKKSPITEEFLRQHGFDEED